MQDKLENLVRMVFGRWKKDQPQPEVHPDEETFSLALQGKLSHGEQSAFEEHVAACDVCAELVGVYFQAAQSEGAEVPRETMERAREAIAAAGQSGTDVFEVVVRIKDRLLELVKSSGDVLIGQEFIPAAALRSRNQAEFSGALTVIRDCAHFRCQIGIERAAGGGIRLTVGVVDRATGKPVSDVRFTLSAGDKELESRLAERGTLVFEAVPAGSYAISVEDASGRNALIHLEALS